MQVYVADYTADVQHLTCEQDGAYWRLLRAMWRAGGTLPNDDHKLSRICGLSLTRWLKISVDIMPLFVVENGLISQRRLTLEIQKANEKSQKRSEAGKIGARAKSLKNNKPPPTNALRLLKHSLELEEELTLFSSVDKSTVAKSDVSTDLNREAWNTGVELFVSTGLSVPRARQIFGRLLSANAIQAKDLLPAITTARLNQTADPVSYLTKAAERKSPPPVRDAVF